MFAGATFVSEEIENKQHSWDGDNFDDIIDKFGDDLVRNKYTKNEEYSWDGDSFDDIFDKFGDDVDSQANMFRRTPQPVITLLRTTNSCTKAAAMITDEKKTIRRCRISL